MAMHEDSECPHLRPRQLRTAAIIQNIVRYYNRKLRIPTSGNDRDINPQSVCTASTTCTDSESSYPSTAKPSNRSAELPSNASPLPHDPTLTAFAQLAAIRLDCERGFISLIDHQHQYVLAEATRSVSLENPGQCLLGDEVWIGPTKFDLSFGVCPESIQVFDADDEELNVTSENVTANKRCYAVNDLSAMECFRDRPYVSGWPFIRFYAEVPLKTDGYIIGSVCVADKTPRSGLDITALDRLAEISSAVASHLELVQAQNRLRRSQEMLRGLGRFVDGKSVRDWWKDTFNDQFRRLPEFNQNPSDQEPGFAKTLSTASEHRNMVSPTPQSPEARSKSPSINSFELDTEHFDSLVVTAANTSRSSTNDKLPTRPLGPVPQFGQGRFCSPDSDSAQVSVSTPSSGDPLQKENISNEAIKRLFSRASHLIRESCDLRGIIFVDASLQDIAITQQRQKSVSNLANTPRFGDLQDSLNGRGSGFSPSMKRNSSLLTGPSDLPAFIREGFKAQVDASLSETKTPTCHLLGYSIQSENERGSSAPSDRHLNISQSMLRNLLRRYPNGHIFLFNSDGSLVDGEGKCSVAHGKRGDRSRSASKGKSMFEKEKEQLRAYQLLDICPGALAIIFFPLWDPQKDQWFAGSLAWTNDPARLLQTEDVTFLAAFGSCIMGEKSKIDALAADHAKTDFISSVSHELRTPLHGMLATMEVLSDTPTNMEQDELIRTVSTCGEILMDTMDHILDYAKIKNSKQLQGVKLREQTQKSSSHNANITSFDVSNLIEGVVEGIFAGHNYRGMITAGKGSSEQAHRFEEQRAVRLTPPSMNPDVMIILDIERQSNWLFDSQIGAWKRILTNLFGNSLKYTESGYVRISLHAIPSPSPQEFSIVILEIEDSGIGMTQDYVKHRLYTPFSQANPMSTGTGLGLSIVRQLVNDLDGTINIDSEVGHGTLIKVSVPSNLPSSDQANKQSVESSATIRDIRAWCRGLKLCLVGFDFYPEIEEAPTGILSAHAKRMLFIRSSVSTLAADWFDMEVVIASSLEVAKGDFLIGVQSQIDLTHRFTREEPLVVFEDIHSGFRARNEGGVFYLSQPVGPHKFARLLGLCLEYRSSIMGTPKSPFARATTYGFPSSPGLVHDSEKGIQPVAESSTDSSGLCQEGTSTAAQEVSRSAILPTRGAIPELSLPILVKQRSIVLLVEDNYINMKILVNHMKRAKEEYISAVNGLEALHKYQAGHQYIKVIFMANANVSVKDIAMPVKDGIAATKEIRQFEREAFLPRVRIAALTCFSSEESQTNAFAAGVDLYLIKPVPMKDLKPILEMDPDLVVAP